MKIPKQIVIPLLLTVVSLFLWQQGVQAQAGAVAPELQQAIEEGGEVSFIIRFAQVVDVNTFQTRGRVTQAQRAELVRALQEQARSAHEPAIALLKGVGAKRVVQLWSINALAVTARADIIQQLAALPGVESIEPDVSLQAPTQQQATASTAEWNLDMVRAPELWGLGYTGVGTVIASVDTGVDVDHPDLATSWRGGSNSWFDPNGEHDTPYDSNGHGTQVMGLALGGDAGGTAIGIAPGAQWIAVKIFDDGGAALLSEIHQGLQWLLDPDQDPATDDTPDVVNNSWGFPQLMDQCYTEFETDIEVLKAAGIAVVFSAGNNGPSGSSSVSPANNPAGYAVGAVDSSSNVATSSSRGPSACGGSLYPEVMAPGVNVRTTDLTFGGLFPDSYVSVTGTSAAAPHVAGTMALLREAHIDASVAELEQSLRESAVDLGALGPDNDTGYGLVDVVAASEWLSSHTSPPPTCTDLDSDGFFVEDTCGTLVDCNDGDAGINPDACDIKGDGIDQDCDGVDRLKGKSCPVSGGDGSGGGVEGKGSTCSDAIDNDGDGLIDCIDPDCSKNRVCRL